MKIKFTKHAEDILKERNIDITFVEDAVRNPDWKEYAEDELWYAFKRVEGKVLRVVIKGRKKPYMIVTMYYDGRVKK